MQAKSRLTSLTFTILRLRECGIAETLFPLPFLLTTSSTPGAARDCGTTSSTSFELLFGYEIASLRVDAYYFLSRGKS